MNLSRYSLPLLALVAITSAHADPKIITKNKTGEVKYLKWNLDYLQIKDAVLPAHVKVNAKLEAYVEDYMKPSPHHEDDDGTHEVEIRMNVGVITDTLISVKVSNWAYYGGAHGISGAEILTYDLRTAEAIPPSAFFAGGDALNDVAGRVGKAISEDYAQFNLEKPTADNLGSILVTETGLTFIWGQYGLGAPGVVGPVEATLTWAELDGTIYTQGVLGSLVSGDAPTVTVDVPLGGGYKPDPSDEDLAYLKRLEVEAVNSLTQLDPRQRAALAESDVWKQNVESGRALASLLDQEQLQKVAQRLRYAQNDARTQYPNVSFTYFLEDEASALKRAIDFALNNLEAGVATSNDVAVLSTPQFAGDEGKALATLGAGERVGVMRRAGPGEDYHQVRAMNGALGRVHRDKLAIEVLVTAEGQVQEDYSGDLVLGADGPLVRANRSVEVSRSVIGELKGLVGGSNANVVLKAVEVTHRGRSWLVPYAFRSVPAGSPSVGAQPGVVSQLDQD